MRGRLLLLVACVALPFAVFVAWALFDAYRRDLDRTASNLLTTATAMTSLVDRELIGAEQRLRILADADATRAVDQDLLIDLLQPNLVRQGLQISLYDRSGRALGVAGLPDAEAELHRALAESLPGLVDRALSSGQTLFVGRIGGRVGVLVPVPRAATPTVLGLWLPSERLSDLLHGQRLPAGWVAAVLDRSGTIVARTRHPESVVGHQATAPVMEGLARQNRGVLTHAVSQDGQGAVIAYARAERSGFAVALAVPRASFTQPLRADLTRAAAVALALLTGGVVGALLLAAHLRRALSDLAQQAWHGSVVPLVSGLTEVEQVSAALAEAALDRETATSALREQEGRYRALVDATSDVVWMADPGGRLDNASARRWAELSGLDPAVLTGDGWFAALHPDDRLGAGARWQAALRMGEVFEGDARVRRDGGEHGWFHLRAVPLRGANNTVEGWIGLLADVTRERAAARALAESEARLRLAVEGGGFGTWDIDLARREWRLSAGTAVALGLPPRDIVAPIHRLGSVHPNDRAQVESVLSVSLAPGGPPFATEFRTATPAADGGERWVEARARVLRDEDGDAVRMVGVLRDITERHRADAAVIESEARFRSLAEAVPLLVWSARPDGGREWFNRRWYDFTGAAPGATDGLNWINVVHPEDRERAATAWDCSLATGQDYAIEHRLRDRHGAHRWFLGQGLPLRDEAGRISRWLGTCTDIHDIILAREERARQAEELERLVAERTASLAESERRLSQAQKMEALGRLAGGVAHDVNNVLQAVLGGARLIAGRAAGDPARVAQLAALVGEQAERGAAVARRLLGFARQGELRAEAFALPAVLEGVREVLAHTLGGAVSVTLRLDHDMPPAFADRAQLETVLVNLALNARDAMRGGGAIAIEARPEHGDAVPEVSGAAPGRARIGAPPSGSGRFLRITLSDQGHGMSAEVLARAMEPFFTTKPKGEGTGLGLAMAKGFAEQSDGALMVESAPDAGTAVTLWLPVAAGNLPAARAVSGDVADAPRAAVPAGTRLLVVDDEPAVRAVLAAALVDAGYDVVEADGPVGALELLRTGRPLDAVVTDLAMPGGMDGLDLLVEARRLRPRLPGLLLTGYAAESAAARLHRAAHEGAFRLLRKPVDENVLTRSVAELLEAPDAA